MKRRTFTKSTSMALVGVSLGAPNILRAGRKKDSKLRLAFIGTGLRGRNHVRNMIVEKDVECVAISDIDPEAVKETKKLFDKYNVGFPKVYGEHEYSYREMLEKEDLDAVVIAPNWKWHTTMCIDAMEAGVFTGVEVAGAFSVDECWDLVNTHQRTGTHLMFMENVCYRRDVMAVLNMVRDNVFGELLHLRGGYMHDLRHVKFDDGKGGVAFGENGFAEARWRTEHSLRRNGDLYPTHGLGPVSMMVNMNRGNRLLSISSFATKSRSLQSYVAKHPKGGKYHAYTQLDWQLGDIVTSTITTANGETIIITHDTNTARPYSLDFRVQGVEGVIDFDYGTQRIHIQEKTQAHSWEDAKPWLKEYDHPLWKEFGDVARDAGHGGMDFFLDRQFIQSAKDNTPPVIDVYDAATMRAITPLSEASIREGGAVQQIPDFTEGKWITKKPVFGLV
ncbi:Gfo/Idh/MocA family oxidoreductase [Fulvivirgaceae bacterium BMA10]|uniref:Gfo/Idh/MocA family oxidoreductase n=1 Tax=Splendidivirga corallicola TaxID=3051826 RepID=A0ABT8KT56_9BACT|nr:Gfo/Idh/MocA family oxidoreductase [Fulvivirgaceae bacterium BMA10]